MPHTQANSSQPQDIFKPFSPPSAAPALSLAGDEADELGHALLHRLRGRAFGLGALSQSAKTTACRALLMRSLHARALLSCGCPPTSLASFAILALAGSVFFMMRAMLAMGKNRSCSLPAAAPSPSLSLMLGGGVDK